MNIKYQINTKDFLLQKVNVKKTRRNYEEFREQKNFIKWCGYNPELRGFVLHVPNGGNRDIKEASNLKKMGVLKGVWDIFVAIPSKGYGGLWIEFKSEKGKLSSDQILFQERMKNNYSCKIARNWIEARKELQDYLSK